MTTIQTTQLLSLIGRTITLTKSTDYSGIIAPGTTGTIIAIEGLTKSKYCSPVKVRFDDDENTVRYFKLGQLAALALA
jgi:hypothetical protein